MNFTTNPGGDKKAIGLKHITIVDGKEAHLSFPKDKLSKNVNLF